MDRRTRSGKGLRPKCLCYFNTETNCAAILGMRYFGEHKKGTLTLAWAIANRNATPAATAVRRNTPADGHKFVSAVFGLSGSGKSTLTHAKHGGKYPSIKVLHDDASSSTPIPAPPLLWSPPISTRPPTIPWIPRTTSTC